MELISAGHKERLKQYLCCQGVKESEHSSGTSKGLLMVVCRIYTESTKGGRPMWEMRLIPLVLHCLLRTQAVMMMGEPEWGQWHLQWEEGF